MSIPANLARLLDLFDRFGPTTSRPNPTPPGVDFSILPTRDEYISGHLTDAVVDAETDCPICHEGLDSDVVSADCSHLFHKDCLVRWFKGTENAHADRSPGATEVSDALADELEGLTIEDEQSSNADTSTVEEQLPVVENGLDFPPEAYQPQDGDESDDDYDEASDYYNPERYGYPRLERNTGSTTCPTCRKHLFKPPGWPFGGINAHELEQHFLNPWRAAVTQVNNAKMLDTTKPSTYHEIYDFLVADICERIQTSIQETYGVQFHENTATYCILDLFLRHFGTEMPIEKYNAYLSQRASCYAEIQPQPEHTQFIHRADSSLTVRRTFPGRGPATRMSWELVDKAGTELQMGRRVLRPRASMFIEDPDTGFEYDWTVGELGDGTVYLDWGEGPRNGLVRIEQDDVGGGVKVVFWWVSGSRFSVEVRWD